MKFFGTPQMGTLFFSRSSLFTLTTPFSHLMMLVPCAPGYMPGHAPFVL